LSDDGGVVCSSPSNNPVTSPLVSNVFIHSNNPESITLGYFLEKYFLAVYHAKI